MGKKCKKCGAPLEGFFASSIGKLLGVKESEKASGYCNKCEDEVEPRELEEETEIGEEEEQEESEEENEKEEE